MEASEGQHAVLVMSGKAQQTPAQHTKPDAMPKDDGIVFQVWHFGYKTINPVAELSDGIGLLAHAFVDVAFRPVLLGDLSALLPHHAFDKFIGNGMDFI